MVPPTTAGVCKQFLPIKVRIVSGFYFRSTANRVDGALKKKRRHTIQSRENGALPNTNTTSAITTHTVLVSSLQLSEPAGSAATADMYVPVHKMLHILLGD